MGEVFGGGNAMIDTFAARLLEQWLTPDKTGFAIRRDEAPLMESLLRELDALFTRNEVTVSPLLAMRVEDALVAFLAVRRVLEMAPEDQNGKPFHDYLEQLNKAIERRRKAVKELEDTCERAGAPLEQGLAERLLPLIERAEGVIEDAHAFEQRKQTQQPTTPRQAKG